MQTFETTHPIALTIELSHGAVHLIATERADTVVSVNPREADRADDVEAAAKTIVELTNGTLSIRQRKPGGIAAPVIGWKGRGAVEVTVELPELSSLRADAGVADFRLDGRLADVDIKTGVGNVRLDRTAGLRVRTGAGNVDVEEATGNADVVATGDLTVGAISGNADIKNLNGKTWIGTVERRREAQVGERRRDDRRRRSRRHGEDRQRQHPTRPGRSGCGQHRNRFRCARGRDRGRHGRLDRGLDQVRAPPEPAHPRRESGPRGRDRPGPCPDLLRRHHDHTILNRQHAQTEKETMNEITTAIEVQTPLEGVHERPGPPRRVVRRRARHGVRPARRQRLGQDHHHQHPHHADRGRRRHGDRCRVRRGDPSRQGPREHQRDRTVRRGRRRPHRPREPRAHQPTAPRRRPATGPPPICSTTSTSPTPPTAACSPSPAGCGAGSTSP